MKETEEGRGRGERERETKEGRGERERKMTEGGREGGSEIENKERLLSAIPVQAETQK